MLVNHAEIEVRYKETDQMGIVHHSNYLQWFEIGRTKFIEQLGFTYFEMEENGVLIPVTDAYMSYKKPAKYGQKVYVETTLREYKGARITFDYTIKSSEGEVLVTGYTKHGLVGKDLKPVRLRNVNEEWHLAMQNAIKG